ncbi:MAG: sortase [Chloroflexi bacterium]|nr:sortase [Chloroflexota bacterium]
MKPHHKIFSIVLILAVFLLISTNVVADTQTITGSAARGNLTISLIDSGAMRVQMYINGVWEDAMFAETAKGTTLCIGNLAYRMGGEGGWAATSNDIPTHVSIPQDSNSIVGKWTMATISETDTISVTQTISYTDGNNFYTSKWEVKNLSETPINDLRLVHGGNNALYGNDSGMGWWNAALGKGSVGVTQATNGSKMWLQATNETPAHHTSQDVESASGESEKCLLSNTVTSTAHDNGYALEWDHASLAASETWTVTAEEYFAIPETPVITSVSPASGPIEGGTLVTLTGTGFQSDSVVKFDGIAPSCTRLSETQITCTTAAHAIGPVNIGLTTSFDAITLANGYTYLAPSVAPAAPEVLPVTGFQLGILTLLAPQPVGKSYTAYRDSMHLIIPKLNVDAEIVGIPQSGTSWDVSWLGEKVGYLYGSAFPTGEGNSVLTGHVWNADNSPGLFVDLKKLQYGDRFSIEAFGTISVYEVRSTFLVSANNIKALLKHYEGHSWITLTTCENFNLLGGNYTQRRLVRAVLVEVN